MFQRLFYTALLYLLTPLVLYRLAARGFKYHGYFARWRERFGFFPDPGIRDSIWVHAVSLGEVNAAVPLIEALMRRYGDSRFVITTVTPTGSARVLQLFGDRVFHVYLPYDLTTAVRRFLDRVRPRLAVIMETEIWPNLFMTCADRAISIVIANARLSEKSLRGYWPIQPLARRAIRCASFTAAQSASDGERLHALGAPTERLAVVGNLKFDMNVPAEVVERGREFRFAAGADRPVWIAASTHEGEELVVLKAHAEVLRRFPDALLLIAPRHPERFKALATACKAFGFRTATRSEERNADRAKQCFVIDSMGELLGFYAAADVAFVGGSLVAGRRPQSARAGGARAAGHRRPAHVQFRRSHRGPDQGRCGAAHSGRRCARPGRGAAPFARHRAAHDGRGRAPRDGARARRGGADDGDRRARAAGRAAAEDSGPKRAKPSLASDSAPFWFARHSSSALISARSLTSITPAACLSRSPSSTKAWRACE